MADSLAVVSASRDDRFIQAAEASVHHHTAYLLASWQLNGTAQKLRQARLLHNYQRSAEVLDVLLCHKCYLVETTAVEDFLCIHNRFEDPQYIIDNENITLLTINEHDAVFCEAKEKGKHE